MSTSPDSVSYTQTIAELLAPSQAPQWQSTARPSQPRAGRIGYDTVNSRFEFYDGSWKHAAWLEGAAFTGAVTFDNSIVVGNASAGKVTVAANAITMPSGQNLTLSMGGNGTSFTVSGTGGTGTLAVFNASTTQNTIDFTGNAKNLIKTPLLNVTGTTALPTSWASTSTPLYVNKTFSGTMGSGDYALNAIYAINETIGSSPGPNVLLQLLNSNAAGAYGGRSVFMARHYQNGATANAAQSIDPYYEAGRFVVDGSYNEGGTSGVTANWKGHQYSLGLYARLNTGATNWYANIGIEQDMLMQTGTSALRNVGHHVVLLSGHAAQGTVGDAAYMIGAQGGVTTGLKAGLSFGDAIDSWAMDADAVLIAAPLNVNYYSASMPSAWFADMLRPTFSGGLIRSRGMQINGDGSARFGTAYVTPGSSGLTLDVSGLIGPAVGATISGGSITSAGSSYSVNDALADSYGGIYRVTAVDGAGAITELTVYAQPYAPSGTSGALTLANDSYSVGTGTVTISITWTNTRNGLVLQSSSAKLAFYGGTPATKPTVTGSKGANAALTSLLTALSGLGLLTDSTT